MLRDSYIGGKVKAQPEKPEWWLLVERELAFLPRRAHRIREVPLISSPKELFLVIP